ncbi:ABC transporter ATP-binding protein [uncultured Amnibacterium sp.]|uniref:ABC transporter ATP-binding protein n=1 Tax=uncultured Amnibacterium sp. TaxID=1631851 RepID=UPI0035C9BDCD
MPPEAAAEPVLEVVDLVAGYHGLPVVRDLSLTVRKGEVVALLGANGAGKTTTLRTIAGLLKPLSGTITVGGASTAGRTAHALARRGVALVPEDRAIFADLTTRENLRVAATSKAKEREAQVLDLLPELKKCLGRKAGNLSGGEQQMLAVGRALAGQPRLLVVDEMSLGLAPVVVQRLLPVLRDIAALGTAVLVVEQHVHLALEVVDRAYVLAHGRLRVEGDAADLRRDASLIAASYFGDADAAEQLVESAGLADEVRIAPPDTPPPGTTP